MTTATVPLDVKTETFDVLIVGAGISGIDAAYHLRNYFPERTFVVLDALDDFGGTWRTHKYPGARSDSDLYTFGYKFKPWVGPPIATAEEIRTYLSEVIEENDLAPHIRYRHQVETASWSSESSQWTVTATDGAAGEPRRFAANFLWMCQGYYRHDQGYTPQWPGFDQYQGRVVHPQTWPEDLDLTGKRVVIIGSGATTATLVPAISGQCAHVTVLQRSPTYYWPGPNRNEVADMLRELDLPEEWVHEIVRRKILHDMKVMMDVAFEQPEFAKDVLIETVRPLLPEGFDVETHFTPRYRPWQQRLARVPDGDIFTAISAGKVSMVTDQIERFTQHGILTQSGEELAADVVITATGFHLSVLGEVAFEVDGEAVDFAKTVTWRGMMFTGVPNLVWVFGYFRASWTLRADLVCELVGRMFIHMKELGAAAVTPQLRPQDATMAIGSWIDPENFNPGYLMRSMDKMPQRGEKVEWQHNQDYWLEKDLLPVVDLDDGCLIYR
jgi:cation diffusion facilitator CzcD-associated flavoprotein CzcO